jgi:hypothetical protein
MLRSKLPLGIFGTAKQAAEKGHDLIRGTERIPGGAKTGCGKTPILMRE